ncbi:MAG: zinc-ribbon domain-containing protein [Oscillospiraceae bacterium]|nr:zinc-ribbon domain-containing protein [Oscillospiraceae bacterium]
MKCQKCGNEVSENARFCGKCGADISRNAEMPGNGNICTQCGNRLKSDASFCGKCGHPTGGANSGGNAVNRVPVGGMGPGANAVNRAPAGDMNPGGNANFTLCPRCGKRLNPSAQFCIECGTILNAVPNRSIPSGSVPAGNIPVKKNNTGLIVTVIIVAVIAAAALTAAIIFGISHFGKNKSEDTDDPPMKLSDISRDHKDAEIINDNPDNSAAGEPAADTAPVDPNINNDINNPDFFFPSDTVYISERDLFYLSREDVAFIRNEIYARHGYIFQNEPYKSYFAQKAWYIPNPNFNESMFNPVERANKDFLVQYEKKMGWR